MLFALLGLLFGVEFPAAAVLLQKGTSARGAAVVYATDLLGGAMAALFTASLLLGSWGVVRVLAAFAVLRVLALASALCHLRHSRRASQEESLESATGVGLSGAVFERAIPQEERAPRWIHSISELDLEGRVAGCGSNS